jgi:hypothetical protein
VAAVKKGISGFNDDFSAMCSQGGQAKNDSKKELDYSPGERFRDVGSYGEFDLSFEDLRSFPKFIE